MSTSRALVTTKKSSWKDSALTGASLALKIAKEATGDVPIVKQIVGVALSIVEIAEKAEKNRDALRMLAEKAATLAQRVKQVVTDRPVNGQLSPLLVPLTLVLDKVEAFMLKETAKSNAVTKMYRSIFVLQRKVDELANEMQTEIDAFMMAALADTRLYLAENAQHNGQFALLRDYQVRKLAVIFERETEHGTVTYAQARVDGVSELMPSENPGEPWRARLIKMRDARILSDALVPAPRFAVFASPTDRKRPFGDPSPNARAATIYVDIYRARNTLNYCTRIQMKA